MSSPLSNDFFPIPLKCLDIELANHLYKELETLCICFPGRVSGSKTLEQALDFLFESGRRRIPIECCKEEIVEGLPQWDRLPSLNDDSTLGNLPHNEMFIVDILPSKDAWPSPWPLRRFYKVLANGLSLGTPKAGLVAQVEVVKSLDELLIKAELGNITGTIVIFDFEDFTNYGDVSIFRRSGARLAAECGAVGVIIRSLTPNESVSGVHTGAQEEGATIPAACMSIEDIEVLHRLFKRGHRFTGTLHLPCNLSTTTVTSRNLLFEIRGSEFPNEVVIVGGHTDCWDCDYANSQGAHDDGQAVIISLEIIKYLHRYQLLPRRTIRAVLFVDEEISQSGAKAYQQTHASEAEHVQVAIETDMGVGPVCGFGFTGSDTARDTIRNLLVPVQDTLGVELKVDNKWSGNGVDISPMIEKDKIPGLLLRHQDAWWCQEYFHHHHNNSDTINHVDKELLLQNFHVLLLTVWMFANCDERIPHLSKNSNI